MSVYPHYFNMLNYMFTVGLLWLSIFNFVYMNSIEENSSGCLVPKGPLILTDRKTNMQYKPGTIIPNDTSIIYSCPTSYIWEGRAILNYCTDMIFTNGIANWTWEHPECIKLCPPIRDHTIDANCEYKGETVNCRSNVKSSTIAQINCALKYVKPKNQEIHKTIHCQNDGTWDHNPFKCEQTCGSFDEMLQFNLSSNLRKPIDVPYHVNIYTIENNEYKHICGGTLIQSKIVISAAHCFWDDQKSLLYDKSKFIVTAGKFNRDYFSDNETFEIQRVLISKIDIPSIFRGSQNNFEGDIAVLTLDSHIKFNDHIVPICLWPSGDGEFHPNGLSGFVTGFDDKNSETNNHLLRVVSVTGVDTITCRKNGYVRNYSIPNDKFCAYAEKKSENICKGDGGGAFTVYDRRQFWFGGIFSNIITPNHSYDSQCEENSIRTFSNIFFHESFIRNVIDNLYLDDKASNF